MDIKSQIIISLTSYKIISLLVGTIFAYMGYRLFTAGIWGHAGELEGEFGDNKIVLKKAAPGTFFALFGAIIIAITLWKGLEFKDYKIDSSPEGYNKTIEEDKNDMTTQPPLASNSSISKEDELIKITTEKVKESFSGSALEVEELMNKKEMNLKAIKEMNNKTLTRPSMEQVR